MENTNNTPHSDTNTTQEPERVETHEYHKNTGMAVVAYLLFFVPLLTDAKDDPFVKFHVKQGFVVFLASVLVSVLSFIPPVMLFSWILHIGILILAILGIINALNHKEEPLPLIGQFADRFNF